ncbi:HD domain-containing protein [Amycolatopsis sp. AA4]|uniref:HD domain-containing protein n=1 Tax=Actinomycetes TaxID=1760 RepID=UPI0001B54BEE|nr:MULTISPECIES: HD domain-containing protein [Actinomycetes]ATY15514.1 HD domain-containing protein [Amycolatopsis sp. AA4]
MTELLPDPVVALPATPLADAVLEVVRPVESQSVFNHSVRTYLFARLVADRLAGPGFDDDLLFAACVMHDLGVAPDGPHVERFEVEGAERAAEFLVRQGISTADADQVWQAIALHTTAGIAEHRGPLCVLVRAGVAVDFGGPIGTQYLDAVTDEQGEAIHAAYPRLEMVRSLTDAIVAQAAKNPRNAPIPSVPADFLRERAADGETRLERASHSSRWGV